MEQKPLSIPGQDHKLMIRLRASKILLPYLAKPLLRRCFGIGFQGSTTFETELSGALALNEKAFSLRDFTSAPRSSVAGSTSAAVLGIRNTPRPQLR